MKWLLAIWRLRKVPTLRELPGLYLRAAVFGALIGPLFQVGPGAIVGPGYRLYSAEAFALSGFIGAVFTCCFFTAHGIGNAFVRRFTLWPAASDHGNSLYWLQHSCRSAGHIGSNCQPSVEYRLPMVLGLGFGGNVPLYVRFVRPAIGSAGISRGELVNVEMVCELIPWFNGTWRVRLAGGGEHDMSRERAKHLREVMGVL